MTKQTWALAAIACAMLSGCSPSNSTEDTVLESTIAYGAEGSITKEDLFVDAVMSTFKRTVGDDKILSSDDLKAAKPGSIFGRMKDLDPDGNGKLDEKEMREQAYKAFWTFHKNTNGMLDPAEVEKLTNRLKDSPFFRPFIYEA